MPKTPPIEAKPSAYSTFLPPALGESYLDPAFSTPVMRLSDARATPDAAANGGSSHPLFWILPEYSTPACFNSTNAYLLLQHQSYYGLYSGQGKYLKDLPLDISANTEPRWSRVHPALLYYKRGNQLKSHNVRTGQTQIVRTFTEYQKISGGGESDICFDGNHLVLIGDDRDVFVYTIGSGQKGSALNTSAFGAVDSVYISAADEVTITWLEAGTARYQGIELFTQDMVFLRQVARSGGHMDMGRDITGEPILLWTNSNDPSPICANGVVKIRLSDGRQTCLVTFDWSLACHISCADKGWAVISTYAPSDPDPEKVWPTYTNEILRVKMDGSKIQRLAHHRSRPHNSYNWEPKASLSRDGSRLVFASNFNLQALTPGTPKEFSDAFGIFL